MEKDLRPGVIRQGARVGTVAFIATVTFVVLVIATVAVIAAASSGSTHSGGVTTVPAAVREAPEPRPAAGVVSCNEGTCTQDGHGVAYWFQGTGCGEGRTWSSAGTDPSTHAGLWACQTEAEATAQAHREGYP